MTGTCEYCGAPTDVALCSVHGRELREMLTRLPWYVEQLAITNTRTDDLGELVPVASDPEESPAPFNDRAGRQLRKLHIALARMADTVAEHTGVVWSPHYAVGLIPVPPAFVGPLRPNEIRSGLFGAVPTTTNLAHWLAYHYVKVMGCAGAGAFFIAIDKAIRQATNTINRPIPPVYRGPCPTVTGKDEHNRDKICGVPLYGRRGDDHVTCGRCGKTYDWRELESMLLDAVEAYRWTATEILKLMRELGETVPRSTFYHWRGSGRLHIAGYLHDGRVVETPVDAKKDQAVYRLSDVRALRGEQDAAS